MGLPWFPDYPRDYLASAFVAGLTLAEEGIYNRLFKYAWLDDHCSIPADRKQLANLVKGATGPSVERVLEKWVPSPDVEGRLINETLYAHWKHSQDRAAKARRAVLLRWERERASPKAPKKRDPRLPTAEEFAKVDEMVETWNARALPGLPRAQYAAQAQAQGKAVARRVRANPWLHGEFEHIVDAAMARYCMGPSSMLARGEADWLRFSWFATGPLAKIEALRDYKLPMASEGAPSRL